VWLGAKNGIIRKLYDPRVAPEVMLHHEYVPASVNGMKSAKNERKPSQNASAVTLADVS
jgi:hypothetical protein